MQDESAATDYLESREANQSAAWDEVDTYLAEWEESKGKDADVGDMARELDLDSSDDLDEQMRQLGEDGDGSEQVESEGAQNDQADPEKEELRQANAELQRQFSEAEARGFINDAIRTVSEVFDGADFQPPETLIDAFLTKKFLGDERFRRALSDSREPDAGYGVSGMEHWRRTLIKAGEELRRELESMPDSAVTADRDAVAAAVRSAADAPARDDSFPSESQFKDMSDKEFNKLKAKILRGG